MCVPVYLCICLFAGVVQTEFDAMDTITTLNDGWKRSFALCINGRVSSEFSDQWEMQWDKTFAQNIPVPRSRHRQ